MKHHFGYSLFTPLKSVSDLGKDYIVPTFGRYQYIEKEGEKAENIPYWTKDPIEVFSRQVVNTFKNESASLAEIERIDIVTGGDHGAGAFRARIRVIIKLQSGKNLSQDTSIAHIQCKKDNDTVLTNTIIEPLQSGFKKLAENQFMLFYDDNKLLQIKQVSATEQRSDSMPKPNKVIRPNLYITGDLAYYVVMLGKGGSSGHWCYRCDLSKDIWKEANHNNGALWSNTTLKAMSDTGKVGPSAKGVKNIHFGTLSKYIISFYLCYTHQWGW